MRARSAMFRLRVHLPFSRISSARSPPAEYELPRSVDRRLRLPDLHSAEVDPLEGLVS